MPVLLFQPGYILIYSPHLPHSSLSPDCTSLKAGTRFITSWYPRHGDVSANLFIRKGFSTEQAFKSHLTEPPLSSSLAG